jgi:hypothetical protein
MSQVDMRDGSLRGRLSGVVGASWKGINYLRKFVVPANPQSTDQVGVRDTFTSLVDFGRRINSTILKQFTIPMPKKQSPFNRFIQINGDMIKNFVYDITKVKVSVGGLYMAPVSDFYYSHASGRGTFEWVTDLQGEALATDKAIMILYHFETDQYYFKTTVERSVGTCDVIAPAGTLGDTWHGWLFFVQGDKIASDSAHGSGTEA